MGALLVGVALSQGKKRLEKLVPDPFQNLHYTKVVLYNFNLGDSAYMRSQDLISIIEGGKLHKTTVLPGKELDSMQLKKLFGIINNKKTYDGPWAACFVPRHGVVFYNSSDSVVGYIDICFECNYLLSSFQIPASGYYAGPEGEVYYRNYKRIKNVEEAFKKDLIQQKGFNKVGRKKLIDFCNEVGMQYCGEVESSLFHEEE